MDKIFNKKNLLIFCAIILVVVYFVANNFISRYDIKQTELETISTDLNQNATVGYDEFLRQNDALSTNESTYTVSLAKDADAYAIIEATQKHDIEVNVEKTGLYCIRLEYCTLDDYLYDYDISIKINGEFQYSELENMKLKNSWLIDKENTQENKSPKLIKDNGKLVQSLYDRNGYYNSPLKVKLEQGKNTISIIAGEMDIAVYSISFYSENEIPSYKEYAANSFANGGKPIYLEAEYADYRNNASIQEQTDTSSIDTTPASYSLETVNTIGGASFANIGDEITWVVDVKEEGMYSFNMRIRQNFNSGAIVYRTLLLDGEIPFKECEILEVKYKNGWQNFCFSEGDNPYLFKLSKGKHTFTLKVTYGDNAEIINKMSVALDGLNTSYRKIIMLISPNPDPYRDYLIEEKIPDVLENLKTLKTEIKNVSDYLAYINGSRGGDTSVLDNIVRQLESFNKNPDVIPTQLSNFKSNISAIGTWIDDKRSQPLEIDNIELLPQDATLSKQNSGVFRQLTFSVKRFLKSFTKPYIVTTAKANELVEVWTTSGRQQVDVIQRLIDEEFSSKNTISINLKLVQGGTLIPAVVSGIGPDVSIMETNGSAVNFAVRKAVKDLSTFKDFNELYNQFDSEAFVPLSYDGAVYGIPEQRSFPIMFYRKDILEELKLEVPNTWDELYAMMFELQKNNMDVGIGSDINTYMMFLYQNGGKLYNENATGTELLSQEGVIAFKKWTKYFSDFGLPLSYNFVNRFSSGEMPIAIADYTAYNTLVVFAPEIYDLWDIALVPGTMNEDGTIERSVTSSGTCTMMFSSANNYDSAWEFIKWWNGSSTQQAYARNIEIKLGASARYPAANNIAFENMMWTPTQISVLKQQKQYVKGIPEVPGSYFIGRHINNAFRKIVYDSADVKETLLEYSELIDQEIKEKRKELKLN